MCTLNPGIFHLSKQGGEKLNGDFSYNNQCSVFSITAFVQIGPQTCKQVQKRGGSGSGRLSIIFANCSAKPNRGERSESARASTAASEASPLDARAPNAE